MLYVDMDGVLADFDKAVHNHFGALPHEIPDAEMTAEIRNIDNFWLNIPPMTDFWILWEYVSQFDPFILTAVANWDRERCYSSKPIWLSKYLPDHDPTKVLLVRRSEKALHAISETKTNVLIDDYPKNIREWIDAGGIGVLHFDAKTTLDYVKNHNLYKFF